MCDITIVIPTWNRSSLLELCLQSIFKQTSPCHVLVVDDGSTDSTEAVLKLQQKKFQGRLQYLKLAANRGFAGAVNAGIRTVCTDFVALLNNDTEADPRWIEVGLLALNELPEYSFFASRIMNFYQRGILDSAGDCYDRKGIAYKLGHGEAFEEFMNRGEVVGASAAAAFLASDLVTGFSNSYGSSTTWRASIGVEIIRFKGNFLRLGYAIGGMTRKSMSLGYGRKLGSFHLDIGMSFNGGFTFESAKGFDFAMGLIWLMGKTKKKD